MIPHQASRHRRPQVILSSGHMIDVPNRLAPRFPPSKEYAVKIEIEQVLNQWNIGISDLGISSGARGNDIIFGELCLEHSASFLLFMPLPEEDFIEQSVALTGTRWKERFLILKHGAQIIRITDWDKHATEYENIFAYTNIRMIEYAAALRTTHDLRAVLVWDEKPTGDGAGGTSHFASQIHRLGGEIAIINPTKL